MRSISFCFGSLAKDCTVRVRLAVVMLTGLVFLVGSQSHAETRLAVIASQAEELEKLAPLVELGLGKKQGIVLLEREALKQILKEQELQALMTAEGTAKRVALGKLLKADVLVILQGEKKPRPHARVVICETQQGLRFCNQPVEFSKNIEADVDAVLKLVDRAVEKQQRAITDIVAVPPFVNNTLAYEGEHLKGAYARLIEEILLDRPGVLVVELAEARAVAQELAVSNVPAVNRRLPLYLMGEYRLDGKGGKKMSFKVRLLRGAAEVDLRQKDGDLEEMPKLLRQAAGEMFSKSLGQAIKPPDPEVEAKQLVERSRLFSRLANWEEALALTEAALLLKPDQIELHGDAIAYLNAILNVQRSKEFADTYGNLRPNGPTAQLSKALLPATLYHMEISIGTGRVDGASRGRTFPNGSACTNALQWLRSARTLEDYERRKAEFEPVMAMARRVLAAKAAAKVQDEALWALWPYAEAPGPVPRWGTILVGWQERFVREHLPAIRDRRLKLLRDFGYLKGKRGWQSLLGGDLAPPHDPTYLDFLRKSQEVHHLREAAEICIREYLSGEVRGYLASRAERA